MGRRGGNKRKEEEEELHQRLSPFSLFFDHPVVHSTLHPCLSFSSAQEEDDDAVMVQSSQMRSSYICPITQQTLLEPMERLMESWTLVFTLTHLFPPVSLVSTSTLEPRYWTISATSVESSAPSPDVTR